MPRPDPALLPRDPAAASAAQLAWLRKALRSHYERLARDLPWRGERDPYRILVSEVMLQQTRVETVKPYYRAWIERFPGVRALAEADRDDVLKAWEGLGYYRRARNLHAAALVLRDAHGNEVPPDVAELRRLPGVGEYTAGAVASIAFGIAVPAVDGNVRRVLSRLFDEPTPAARWLRETAALLLDADRPGDWNQALMELGATLCAPRRPQCESCPLAAACRARAEGTVDERPGVRSRRTLREARYALLVIVSPGGVLLVRRPEGGLLGGMWALPEQEVASGGEPREVAGALSERWATRLGTGFGELQPLPPVDHTFTHLRAEYLPYVVESGAGVAAPHGTCWIDPRGPTELALPVAQHRVLSTLVEILSPEVR